VANTDDELIRTRVTLLDRLKNWNDQSSWQEFFNIYWKLIYGFARKTGLTEAEAQDALQETMLCVAKNLPGFKYNPEVGTFKGWLLTLTRWRIVDQMRKRGPLAPHRPADGDDPARTATIERIADENSPDMNALWEADWEKTLYVAAMERVKVKLNPQKLQIFDFYVKREWPPEKVAQTFNIKVDQVYLVKNRVTEMLREEIRRLEREAT
jgi:RNA polymerase sigma-70 factor (ECF subfamily)